MIKYYVFMVLSVFIASISQILLKKSAQKPHDSILKEYMNSYVISGYGLLFLSTLFTVLALQGIEFKNAPVIESLGYILILIMSKFILHETITKRKVIGNIVILIGIFVFYL